MAYVLDEQVINWLLEPDESMPSIRYLTLKNITHTDGSELKKTSSETTLSGLIPAILEHQHPGGYWESPDSIYLPKYTATIWQVILLAQMGAGREHPLISKACEYLLGNSMTDFGGFSITGRQSGCANCLQGNACAALLTLGYGDDERLQKAVDWMARSATGDGFSYDRKSSPGSFYLRSGISGPGFLCSANDHQPCAWGAVKIAMALGKTTKANRSPAIKKAILACREFLLSADPAGANYPHPYAKKPSQSWFRFGFPVFYVTDVLQNIEALLGLGLSGDPRLKNAIDLLESKRDDHGRWKMAYSYNGKMWVDIEERGKTSKWVTYRALKVLIDYYQ